MHTDVLPSATLNFIFDAEHILRLAVAKVLARPPLDELRTGRFLADPASTVGQLTGSGANPQLEPFRAKQFDISYEWYFHPESLLAVALFTKSVESTIGYKQGPETINGTWSNHSGFLAQALSEELPNEVRVEPKESFFAVPCTPAGLAALLEQGPVALSRSD